jgi:hypothetical protein
VSTFSLFPSKFAFLRQMNQTKADISSKDASYLIQINSPSLHESVAQRKCF